ncbi:MAG: DUF4974 domain-containing protein [Bacteroidota bacterium]|nr:DUF4974 domain-containing protein [Bacteroidota bacterium]
MTSTDDRIEELIRKFYHGQTSVREEEDLQDLVKDNPLVKEKFNEYNLSFVAKDDLTNDAWMLFYRKYLNTNLKFRFSVRINSILKYAAVFLLAFITFWVVEKYKIEKISYCETIVPKGEKSQVVLPDGTKIWINSESKLKYPTNFNKNSRVVELTGEAYFKVAHDGMKPFIVKTKAYSVKVLGTEFNLMDYDDYHRTETTLFKGSVEILNNNNDLVYTLKPGEKIIYSENSGRFEMKKINDSSTAAWKDNVFFFEDVSFKELCSRLSRWYDVDVILSDKSLENIRFRGKFKNKKSIWQVLNIIKETTPISYTLNDRKLIIYKRRLPME